jgi:hypothetical protein
MFHYHNYGLCAVYNNSEEHRVQCCLHNMRIQRHTAVFSIGVQLIVPARFVDRFGASG